MSKQTIVALYGKRLGFRLRVQTLRNDLRIRLPIITHDGLEGIGPHSIP